MTIENYIQAGLQHLGIYSESISDIIYFIGPACDYRYHQLDYPRAYPPMASTYRTKTDQTDGNELG